MKARSIAVVPTPIALGLAFCEKVMVEEGNRNVTLVGCFSKFSFAQFSSPPLSFSVYALLTDGQGTATVKLVITRLETDEILGQFQGNVHFADRFREVRVRFRVRELSFPAPGRYQFMLVVDDEWVAQRDLEVIRKQVQS